MRNHVRARRAGNSSGVMVFGVIIIIVVALVFVAPSLGLGGTGNIFDQLKNFISQILNGGGGGGGSVSGLAAVSFKLHYTDGTTKIINGFEGYSLLPMTISNEGKELSSIDVDIAVKLDTTATTWTTSEQQHMEFYLKPSLVPKMSSTGTFTNGGASWAQGETKVIAHTTIQASTIDGLVATYGVGTWHVQVNATVTMNVNTAAGQQSGVAATPAGGFDIVYSTSGSAPYLSITTGSVPLHKNP